MKLPRDVVDPWKFPKLDLDYSGVQYSSFPYKVRDTSSTLVFCAILASGSASMKKMMIKNTVPYSDMTLANISGAELASATQSSTVPTDKLEYEGQNIP